MASQPFSKNLLPTGHVWDMHILRMFDEDAGTFTGGGWKLLWHTTESPWYRVDSMENVLDRKNAAPHVVIGGREGLKHPVAVQMIPFNRAGRALQNDPSDGAQTNRANCIQIEVCWYAAQMGQFDHYKALANLAVLIMHRVPIRNGHETRSFSSPKRLSDSEFVKAKGHIGHVHAPDNTHVDPGALNITKLEELITNCPDGGYAL